jgi:DtxR family transcriptional regulator, Mn-dependent transcriptional regulator
MEQTLTNSIQDYLKAIYELSQGQELASTTAVAERLSVSPASVTGMLQRLAAAKPAFVSYKKHQGARLTSAGRKAALRVIRHHRLLETWLVRNLGYTWEDVHPEAELLEHSVSREFERRLAAALGNPAHDPHGEPIPSASLVMPSDHSVPLPALHAGDRAVIRRVQSADPALLRHLGRLGLHIGAHVIAVQNSAYDGVVSLRVAGRKAEVSLGPLAAGHLFVDRKTRSRVGARS